MSKIVWRILITILTSISIHACKPAAPILLTSTPTQVVVKTATSTLEVPAPVSSLAHTPAELVTSTLESQVSAIGLQVVYRKDGNLWVWSAGGKKQLTSNGNVVHFMLSADGSKVMFQRMDSNSAYELWVVNIGGNGERLLVSSDDLEALGKSSETEQIRQAGSTIMLSPYTWVPGTRTIAFGTYRNVKYDGSIYHNDIILVDAESGEKRTLLPAGSGGRFIYSPDGSKIALFTQQYLSIVDADGNHRHDKLLEFQTPTLGEAHYFPQPVWSAEGQYMLLGLPPKDPMHNPTLPTTLWQIPTDGSPPVRLGTTQYPVLLSYSVSFSPDFLQLAYTTNSELTGYQSEIHIANVDGSGDRVVQSGKMIYFWSWSPDGQHFIYYSYPDPDAWYISDLEGNATVMDFLPVDVQVAWVNNDTFMYFIHCETESCAYELRLTSMAGETVVVDQSSDMPVFDFNYH